MAKFKKDSCQSDTKLHMKSIKRKQKHQNRKIKKREMQSLLMNPYGKLVSHPHVPNNREVSNAFNSSWNVEICNISKYKHLDSVKHVNGKGKKCKRKKNKDRSRYHEENHRLSHSSLKFNGVSPTKCNGNHFSNSSWNIETNVSPLNTAHNVKKRKKGKFILKETNKNVVSSKVKGSSSKNLLGSILISDSESQTEDDDEPIETIFQNKYNKNGKLNVNFVNFNTENVKNESFKTSPKKSSKHKKKLKSFDASEIIQDMKNTKKSVKKCKKKLKKSRMEITDVSKNVQNNTEIEVCENISPTKSNGSITESSTEIEILDSTNDSSDLNENVTSTTTKNDVDLEIIENIQTPKCFINLTNMDSEIEIIESMEITERNQNVSSDSDIEVIENIENINSDNTDIVDLNSGKLDQDNTDIVDLNCDKSDQDNADIVDLNCGKSDQDAATTFKKICQYYVLENVCIVILKHPTKLYFEGVLKASVIVGNVQIFGYTLTKEPQIIHSLAGASFLCFETCYDSNLLLPNENLSELGLNKNIIKSLEPSDCILKFEPYTLSKIQFIDNYIKQKFIPQIREDNEIEQFLKCRLEIEDDTFRSIFKSNPQWDQPIQSIISTNNSKTILCGGKNAGKSTLFRYTVNKLLNYNNAVLSLDFDIGQSEFSVPGCISVVKVTKPLLGPNYTHLQKPERSYFLGTISVVNNMDGYLYGIKYILDYCSTNPSYQNIPWVINTMGFVKDIGFSIMIHLARMIQPTHIIQIIQTNRKENYPVNLSAQLLNNSPNMPGWHEDYKGYCAHELYLVNKFTEMKHYLKDNTVANPVNTHWGFRPNELRNVCMISYVNGIIKKENQSLLEVQPVVTTMDDVKLVSSNISETLIPSLFNGNFVALCREQKIEYDKVLYICEGFGIIRGIDNKDIYLLTPLNLQTLKNVTHIMLSAEPLPPSIYMNTKCMDCSVPYVSASKSKQMKTTIAPQRSTYHIFKNYLNKM
ncbi:polynucleotide 5'-hydroxyl-kinase nol9 [Chrysoperla carnea]|uniref:polynucleotide 5'-hydroxyl-kinase nol9 n=1 Tax=Chrysoperla carnea TaxID=189513 RepID=UPI001D0773F7|nr:polynucleotide 5'-hydroxyl-kinase nol9 [Chrysoperla carnea]